MAAGCPADRRGPVVTTVLGILLGVLVVVVITLFTGYFVAQEFGYMAVDRSGLKARANAGDREAQRALKVTTRTSFMLSGAQLGITVTGLVVGYVAEPLIGAGIGDLLGVAGVPAGVGIAVGTVLALLLATVVQMVFGELFPKNLAIARPEPVALRLAVSTQVYLRVFGWLIRVFDAASNTLLRALRIEPVHDVEHAANPRDLEAIIDESRDSGALTADLSTLLDRVLDFTDRQARSAMIPRPQVATVRDDEPLAQLAARLPTGHSRYPVVHHTVDDVVGVLHLRDLLDVPDAELAHRRAADLARPPLFLPDTLRLPQVLDRLQTSGEEFACVTDEYGGLAGIITVEDIAEELVGEITDEHDPQGAPIEPANSPDGWAVPGQLHIDEVERLLDRDLPAGEYRTIGGLVIARLGRLPRTGDTVSVPLPTRRDDEQPTRQLTITVRTVHRRVPATVDLTVTDALPAEGVG